MFIRVLLPAPFSPSRQWISPGSMTRSMWAFATSEPKLLVRPDSSRCMRAASLSDGEPGRQDRWVGCLPGSHRTTPGPGGSGRLGLYLRLDHDLAADDVGLDLVQLGLHVRLDLAVEVVERRDRRTAVLQRSGELGVVELVVDDRDDRVLDRDVHALLDAAHQHRAVLFRAHAAVGVDP